MRFSNFKFRFAKPIYFKKLLAPYCSKTFSSISVYGFLKLFKFLTIKVVRMPIQPQTGISSYHLNIIKKKLRILNHLKNIYLKLYASPPKVHEKLDFQVYLFPLNYYTWCLILFWTIVISGSDRSSSGLKLSFLYNYVLLLLYTSRYTLFNWWFFHKSIFSFLPS